MGKKNQAKLEIPEFNFDQISKELAEIEHKQHIDQIAPALTSVYLKHAEYKDEEGIVRFKKTFTKDEGKALAEDFYDALGYHSHRRVFKMNQKQYDNLRECVDDNGNHYVDVVIQHHYNLSRKGLVKEFSRNDENNISIDAIVKRLEKPIQHHASLLTSGLLDKHDLSDPKHMDAVKQAIANIGEQYKLPKEEYDVTDVQDPQVILGTYVKLSQIKYQVDKGQ